jgi:hypothetical protein
MIDKKQAIRAVTAALALTASATSMAALVANGDFESGGDSWGTEPAGGSSFAFPATGGNGGGYLEMTGSTGGEGWGGVAISTDDPAGALLADFGVVAGGTYDFLFDMQQTNSGGGGIKLESWGETGPISNSGDNFVAGTSDWASFSQSYTIAANATRLKIVLLGISNSNVYGFDNVCIDDCSTAAVPVPAAAWLFGSGLLGLFGIARRKKA